MFKDLFPILIILLTLCAMVFHYLQFGKLRKLLRHHGKPVSNILFGWGILADIRQARILIGKLEKSEESREIEIALRKTDLSFIAVLVVFFGAGAIYLGIVK